jgi:hypothetical protein
MMRRQRSSALGMDHPDGQLAKTESRQRGADRAGDLEFPQGRFDRRLLRGGRADQDFVGGHDRISHGRRELVIASLPPEQDTRIEQQARHRGRSGSLS